MAWTEENNNQLYARIERLAARIRRDLEGCERILDLADEFGADITDQASGDHLKTELVNFKTNVVMPMLAAFGNEAVGTRDRMADLQEWIVSE